MCIRDSPCPVQALQGDAPEQALDVYKRQPKKEVAKLELEMEKLDKYLGGVKNMKTLPKAMFIVDPHKERIAVAEAVSYTHLDVYKRQTPTTSRPIWAFTPLVSSLPITSR